MSPHHRATSHRAHKAHRVQACGSDPIAGIAPQHPVLDEFADQQPVVRGSVHAGMMKTPRRQFNATGVTPIFKRRAAASSRAHPAQSQPVRQPAPRVQIGRCEPRRGFAAAIAKPRLVRPRGKRKDTPRTPVPRFFPRRACSCCQPRHVRMSPPVVVVGKRAQCGRTIARERRPMHQRERARREARKVAYG